MPDMRRPLDQASDTVALRLSPDSLQPRIYRCQISEQLSGPFVEDHN
jgi:hypothetical protein